MILHFITGNPKKVLSANKHLAGSGITVLQKNTELIEPQADTLREVALAKANQVKDMGDASFIVLDAGLVVPGLKGFPGVYTKYVQQTLFSEGLKALVDARCPDKREAYFEHVIVLTHKGHQYVFEDRYQGSIAKYVHPQRTTKGWSDFERIFVPKGCDKVLAQMSVEDDLANEKSARPVSAWDLLKKHLLEIQQPDALELV